MAYYKETTPLSEGSKEKLLKLANTVEKEYVPFNGVKALFYMPDWIASCVPGTFDPDDHRSDYNECNTVACIAGFTCFIFDYEEASKLVDRTADSYYDASARAREILGISPMASNELFISYATHSVTGPEAAEVIRHFANTGEVDWRDLRAKHEDWQTFEEFISTKEIADEERMQFVAGSENYYWRIYIGDVPTKLFTYDCTGIPECYVLELEDEDTKEEQGVFFTCRFVYCSFGICRVLCTRTSS
jgi:hypothetical protein